jgi:PhnB protein
MASRLNPYLSFSDNTKDVMGFYKSVFGGDLTSMTFGDGGMPLDNPAEKDKVMHSQLETPAGYTIMASDMPASMGKPMGNGTISLSGDNDAELRGYWDKLSAGGQVTQPLMQAPWGDTFGMLVDKFGTSWMVNIAGPGRS